MRKVKIERGTDCLQSGLVFLFFFREAGCMMKLGFPLGTLQINQS